MTKIRRYIGDLHGKIDRYLPLTQGVESIQVGDFGVGFVPVPDLPITTRFIRGNHDDPELCRHHPNCIADGTIEGDTMFIGGAWSIDRSYRTEGVNWWPDEELSIAELDRMIDIALKAKPRVMITHDCPTDVIYPLFGVNPVGNRTQQAFNAIWQLCEPELWIFGHWHLNRDVTLRGTRFICLAELAHIDL
jgi:hypothetical protein